MGYGVLGYFLTE